MKKETLNIYDTTVHIFKYDNSDSIEQLMKAREGDTLIIENIVLKLEDTMRVTQILNGEIMMVPATRTRGIKYGEGFNGDNGLLEEFVIVIGEDLDEKQMLNVFLSLGVKEALVSTTPIKSMYNIEGILAEKITADGITDAWLGGPDQIITSGTIKMSDIISKEKPKKKRTKK